MARTPINNGDSGATVRAALNAMFTELYNASLTLPFSGTASSALTTSQSLFSIGGTWNNSGVAFPGALLVNVTNTASAAGSLLADFQVGGASKASIDVGGAAKAASLALGGATIGTDKLSVVGNVTVTAASGHYPTLKLQGDDRSVVLSTSTDGNGLDITGSITTNNDSNSSIKFANSNNTTTYGIIIGDAANILAQRNGANAQTFRLYNAFQDASNYERGVFDWQTTSNVLTIGTQNAGTGSARNLQFVVGGVNKLDYGVTNSNKWTMSNDLYFPVNTSIVFGSVVISGNPAGQLATNGAISRWGSGDLTLNTNSGTILFQSTSTGDITTTFKEKASQTADLSQWQDNSGNIGVKVTGSGRPVLVTVATTVASLPAASTAGAGARAFVTDATSETFRAAVTGGGSYAVPVHSTGTSWLIG